MSYIISNNSHLTLAKQLSEKSGIELINSNIIYFANTEIKTSITTSIRGKNIFIITSPNYNEEKNKSVNDYIIETYLLIKTCKSSDVNSITLICPCFPYARQDKKDNSRVCISARDIADLFTIAGINRIVCFDLHSHQIQGFFNIPCDNFYCINMIHEYLVKNYNINQQFKKTLDSKFVIIAPDEGALKRVQVYANKFKMPFMVVSKERDYSEVNKVERAVLIGEKKYLEGRTAIIVDDMIDTGGTVIKVGELLMSKGAKDVIVIVTHGILSDPAIYRINKSDFIKEVVVSDSLPQDIKKTRCGKLKTYSIVPMLAEVINRLNTGGSLSEIFNN
jgi:ribose-phosphate pyrophosphokinase|tara:strand:- start:325 stop:1326 length:1002 start_codon:yes stop_codon:yes gene_type:complete